MTKRRMSRHQLGAGLLVIAALAAGHAVTSAYPADSAVTAPFLRTGSLGTPVEMRYATVTLMSVEGSTEVDSAGTLLASPGVFVVMRVKTVAKGDLRTLLYAAVTTTNGKTYEAHPGDRSTFDLGDAQPGIPVYGTVVIEMPTSEVAGARLRIALSSNDQARDDMTDIALGVRSAQAAVFAKNKKPIDEVASSDSLHPTESP